MSHHTYTVVAPYGHVTDVREAGGAILGEGLDLAQRGQCWDLPLGDQQADALESAGAELYARQAGESMHEVLERADYTIERQGIGP